MLLMSGHWGSTGQVQGVQESQVTAVTASLGVMAGMLCRENLCLLYLNWQNEFCVFPISNISMLPDIAVKIASGRIGDDTERSASSHPVFNILMKSIDRLIDLI